MGSSFARCTLRAIVVAAIAAIPMAAPGVSAQTGPSGARGLVVAPANRVVAPVSDAVLTRLSGNVHPLALSRYDRGPASASIESGRMVLVLRRSATQQLALDRYMSELADPASPHYRKWLTPEDYGKTYGLSDADLAAVEGWLQSQGFTIEDLPVSRNRVVFSGTLEAIGTAFHTSIHSYMVSGVPHLANVSDPEIRRRSPRSSPASRA